MTKKEKPRSERKEESGSRWLLNSKRPKLLRTGQTHVEDTREKLETFKSFSIFFCLFKKQFKESKFLNFKFDINKSFFIETQVIGN